MAEFFNIVSHPKIYGVSVHDTRQLASHYAQTLRVIPLTVQDYLAALAHLEQRGLDDGAIYDGLHVQAAKKAGCRRIGTMNVKDFARMWAPSQVVDPRQR